MKGHTCDQEENPDQLWKMILNVLYYANNAKNKLKAIVRDAKSVWTILFVPHKFKHTYIVQLWLQLYKK